MTTAPGTPRGNAEFSETVLLAVVACPGRRAIGLDLASSLAIRSVCSMNKPKAQDCSGYRSQWTRSPPAVERDANHDRYGEFQRDRRDPRGPGNTHREHGLASHADRPRTTPASRWSPDEAERPHPAANVRDGSGLIDSPRLEGRASCLEVSVLRAMPPMSTPHPPVREIFHKVDHKYALIDLNEIEPEPSGRFESA